MRQREETPKMPEAKQKRSTAVLAAYEETWETRRYAMLCTVLVTDPEGRPTREFNTLFPLDGTKDVVHFLSELHAFGADVDGITRFGEIWEVLAGVQGWAVPVRQLPAKAFRFDKRCTWASAIIGAKPWKPKREQVREISKGFGLDDWDESGA
jgi:hypothetical protein